MSEDFCCICGEDACGELAEGSPVCQTHFGMVYNGYTLDELRAERDNEAAHVIHNENGTPVALNDGWQHVGDYPPALSPVEQALHWARNNGGILSADILKAAVLDLCAERDALAAQLRKQQNVIDTLKRARDRYLQRLTDVRAERDALKAEDTNGA